MSLLVALLTLTPCQVTSGLEEARLMVRRGLLSQAEQRLESVLADASEHADRARAFLLLGNVDYERGSYERALDRYAEAERDPEADSAVRASAQGNRLMAEQRLARGRELAAHVMGLRCWLIATVASGALAVGWLVRNPRPAGLARRAAR